MELLVDNRRVFGSIAEERRRKAVSLDTPYEPYEKAFRAALERHGRSERAIGTAIDFAKSLDFGASTLKGSYFSHPLRVASFLLELEPRIEANYLVIALIHNVLETARVEPEEIRRRFGDRVASGVAILTVNRAVPFEKIEEAYYRTLFAAGHELALVKLIDKMDNLFVLCVNPDGVVRERYLDEIERRLLPFARRWSADLGRYLEALAADARQTGFLSKKEIV